MLNLGEKLLEAGVISSSQLQEARKREARRRELDAEIRLLRRRLQKGATTLNEVDEMKQDLKRLEAQYDLLK